MALAIAIVLALLSLAVLTYPFVRRRQMFEPSVRADLAEPPGGSALLFDEMRRLRGDLDVGTITEEDFAGRMRELRLAAAAAMRDEENEAIPPLLAEEESARLSDPGLEEGPGTHQPAKSDCEGAPDTTGPDAERG